MSTNMLVRVILDAWNGLRFCKSILLNFIVKMFYEKHDRLLLWSLLPWDRIAEACPRCPSPLFLPWSPINLQHRMLCSAQGERPQEIRASPILQL